MIRVSAVMLEEIAANSFFDKSGAIGVDTGAIGVDTAMTDSLSLSDSSPSPLFSPAESRGCLVHDRLLLPEVRC